MQGTKSGNKKIVSLTLTMYRNYISQILCYESGLSKGVELGLVNGPGPADPAHFYLAHGSNGLGLTGR